MPKTSNRVPFFAELPAVIVKEIKRRAKVGNMPQWQVITHAVRGETPASKVASK